MLAKEGGWVEGGMSSLVVEEGEDQMTSQFCSIKACQMHFAAGMWHWQRVDIWVVEEDESPQATEPCDGLHFTKKEGFWQREGDQL